MAEIYNTEMLLDEMENIELNLVVRVMFIRDGNKPPTEMLAVSLSIF